MWNRHISKSCTMCH